MPKIINRLPDGTQVWRDKTTGEVLAEQLEKGIKPLMGQIGQKEIIKHENNK